MQSVKKSGGNAFEKSPNSAKKRNAVICAAALVLVILIVIAFLLLSGSETAYRSISIAEISGRVMTENNGNSYAAYENMVIGGGYALTTEKESYTRMLLDGDKYMKLEEQSHAVFENLGDPQSHRTVIRLNYGTFTTEITKPLGNNEDYIVNTPNAVLAVRGTFFRVEVSFDTNGDAYTDVYTYGGAVACHRIMPDGTEVDEEVMIDTGYKARIKMDEIITVYVEELIEYEEDHVDPLEMSDVGDGQLVDVYNASAHGHEMFRSTKELWDEIVEREINLNDYVSVYDGEKIVPYAADEKPTETFVTTPAPETAQKVNPPDNTETQQPESSLLSDTTGSEPIIAEASVLPAGTTAAEVFAEPFPETDSTVAPTGNVAAETVAPNPIGTSGTSPTGRPAVTTAPNGITATTTEETTELTGETEETEDMEETEGAAPAAVIAETTTTTAANQSPSAEIVTRPQAFTTSVPPIPVITTVSTEPSHVHTLVEETVAASCTETGVVRIRCSVCGTVVSETVIPALGHNTGSVTVAAACEEDGERLDVCKLCGVIVSQAVIPATGHTETVETVEATCTASGSITVKCSVCGKILSQETIPMTDHIADITTVAATCEKNGERTEKCRICGTVLSAAVIPAMGHTRITETVEATCTVSGSITIKCSVCGKIFSRESIPVTAHIAETATVAATCEENGERTEKCRICGTVLSTTVLPAAGHSYEAVETKPASCTEEGEEAEICTVCGQEKPDSAAAIPKLPHTEVTESDGSIETVKCSVCGEILSRAALINETNFPDEVFRNYLFDNFDTDESGSLSETELSRITEIAVSGEVGSLKGIELLPALESVRATVHIEDGVIAAADVGGIDPGKVSGVSGGNYDESTGTISEIADGAEITLIYTPEGGNSVTFTLVPDETSTFWTETPEGIAINAENFPDEVFRNYVSENFDTDGDGALSEEECGAVTEVDVSGILNESEAKDGGVMSLRGIEYFENLASLKCTFNYSLAELDVSNNAALTELRCSDTQIALLDVSNNAALKNLYCFNTKITSLDVSNNTALTLLYCGNTQISSLDASNNTALTSLDCSNTQITLLDISNNTALERLNCYNSQLAYVDTSNNPSISIFYFFARDNRHPITVTNGSFDTHTIDGFDPTKVFDVVGAEWDETTGVFSGITEGTTEITYTYDCKGTNEDDYKVTFTLVPDEDSTFEPVFDGTIYMDDGSVTITSTGFTQGSSPEETLWIGDYVITQRNSSAEITAYIDVEGTHNITFDGLNLCYYGMVVNLEGNITVKGTSNKNKFVCKKMDGLDSHGIIYTGLYCDRGDIVFESGIIETDSIDYSIYISAYGNGSHPIIDGASITALNKVFISGSSDTLTLNSGTLNVRNVSGSTASTGSGTMYVNGGLAVIDSERYIIGKKGIIMGGSMCFAPNTNTNGKITNAFGDELECVVYDTFPSEAERTFVNSDGSAYVYSLNEDDCADDGKYYIWKPKAAPKGIAVNAENFPDEVFRNYVSENFDTDSDGYLSETEIEDTTYINMGDIGENVASLKGIEYFINLTILLCGESDKLTELDVSKNTKLTGLDCGNIRITELDISKNTALTWLNCGVTQITSLDVSKNTALETLYCDFIQITSLDVSQNTALEFLCVKYTQITSLDVSNNTALTRLYCDNTQITSLDVSKNTALTELECYNSRFAYVDISNNPSISYLSASNNKHPITVVNGSFDTHTIDGFDSTRVSDVQGAEWDEAVGVFSNIAEGTTEITYTYDCDGTGGHNEIFTLVPDENSTFEPETPEGIAINAENFPDEVFREYITTNFDTDSNNYLSQEECDNVLEITFREKRIRSLKGIEYFAKLQSLACYNYYGFYDLDISRNPELTYLECQTTSISNLDLSNNTKLKYLSCGSTYISKLDVSNNTALEELWCSNTQITELDVSQNTALKTLRCNDTLITELDVSNNTALTELVCYKTAITSINVSKNIVLTWLDCHDTQITSLDVSKNIALTQLDCYNTQIPFVDISNNPDLKSSVYVFDNKYQIPAETLSFDITTDLNFAGFNPNRVSNVVGADFSPESGIFYNFTSDTITYTYDCDGAGGHNVTFTLVRTAEAAASLSDEGDNFAVFPPDTSGNFTLPGASDADIPVSDEGASPFGGAELFSLLPPVGLLAFAHSRKRKTAFRFAQKAEIN